LQLTNQIKIIEIAQHKCFKSFPQIKLLKTSAISKLFNPLNRFPTAQFCKTDVVSSTPDATNQGLHEILKHMKYLNWLGLLSVTFDCMLAIRLSQKNGPKS